MVVSAGRFATRVIALAKFFKKLKKLLNIDRIVGNILTQIILFDQKRIFYYEISSEVRSQRRSADRMPSAFVLSLEYPPRFGCPSSVYVHWL